MDIECFNKTCGKFGFKKGQHVIDHHNFHIKTLTKEVVFRGQKENILACYTSKKWVLISLSNFVGTVHSDGKIDFQTTGALFCGFVYEEADMLKILEIIHRSFE